MCTNDLYRHVFQFFLASLRVKHFLANIAVNTTRQETSSYTIIHFICRSRGEVAIQQFLHNRLESTYELLTREAVVCNLDLR
jgi:hypothetical protein